MKRIIYTLIGVILSVSAWAQNVAQIGSAEYATLADAIAAVPTDGTVTTIKMLADADLSADLKVANTQKIVLDLNGKTVKNDPSKSLAQLITVNGSLTIDDSSAGKDGVIKNTASAKYVIKNGVAAAVLTLNNGTIETTTGNSNGAVYALFGSFVMTGGKIVAAGTGVTSKNVNISGGVITATAGQALCVAGTITGGQFTSANNNAVYANQSGTLEITGGDFSGISSKPTINIYTTDVKITSATLNNGVGFTSNATAMILPGSEDAYLSATHAAIYDGDNLVGYAPINTGILTNSKVAGKTVTLTKDVATTTYMNISKSFTLDLNGHNITCNPTKADAVFAFKGTSSAPVNVTIKGEGQVSCGDHGEGCNVMQVGNYSTVNIEGGSFSVPGNNSTIYLLPTAGTSTVNISGGTFQSGDGKYVLNIKDDSRDYSSFIVTGGTFVGFNPADNIAEGEHTSFVAPGYEAVDNGDGTFSAVINENVAKIGDTKYNTLADAITDAVTGQTITLLADVQIETINDWKEGVNIDKNGWTLTVNTFNVVDFKACSIPFDFIANTATYTRSVASNLWGTVCLPFTLRSCDKYTLYQVVSIDGESLVVEKTDSDVDPGTPVIFKTSSAVASVTFSTSDAQVAADEPVAASKLTGTYSEKVIQDNLSSLYYINGDKFHQAKASLTVPAYRAYISNAAAGAKPSMLNIFVDGMATAIDNISKKNDEVKSIYDFNGINLSAPKKGVNIMKLADGKTVKIIIK